MPRQRRPSLHMQRPPAHRAGLVADAAPVRALARRRHHDVGASQRLSLLLRSSPHRHPLEAWRRKLPWMWLLTSSADSSIRRLQRVARQLAAAKAH